jgi:signal transduction histidine kinase
MQQVSGIDEHIGSSILQVVLETSDNSAILSNLANKVGHLLMADVCIVVSTLTDSPHVDEIGYWQREFLPGLAFAQLNHLPLNLRSLSHYSANSPIIEAGSPLFEAINHLLPDLLPETGWLGAVTQFQNQTNGLVLLLNQASSWTQTEQELLTKTLDSMAIAISQVQLQKQAQTKTRYQSLLKNLSREISQGYEPQSLFHNCLVETCSALKIDRGMILLLKYQNPLRAKGRAKSSVKGTAKIVCQWNSQVENSPSPPEVSFSLDNSDLCQKAWRNAPDCLYFSCDTAFPDLTTDQRSQQAPSFYPHSRASGGVICDFLNPGGSALLMMPLMGKKTSETDSAMVMGFLVLQHNSLRHWSKDELDLIDWVSVQISTAIVHHQTLNRVQLIVDERTAQLKSSLDMQAKLSAKMRQHIQQLQKLNQLKDDFMNSMSHELKTPLTSMKIAIKMLRQAQIPPEMREKYLDILEQEWNREYSLIKDLLTLQQLESGELDYSPQEFDLKQTIEVVAQSFAAKLRSQGEITLTTMLSAPEFSIHTDEESLKHILNELLSNAGKYCDPQSNIEISVSSQRTIEQENIIISVVNVGEGITPDELPFIFDKFRRGKGVTDRAVPGTGLGLTLVQYLVEHLNGTIEVTSEPLDDDSAAFLTTFMLKLPQIKPVIS